MSSIECGRGHLYDPDIYTTCPYCNSAQQAVYFSGTPVGAGGKTMPISGGVQPSVDTPVVAGNGTLAQAGYSGKSSISVMADGKTAPPKGYALPNQNSVVDENKTVGMMGERFGIEPVVGWLVCVFGKQKGKSYELKGRINTIGRSEKMDICIKDDKTISLDNHARLGYGEKNNRFTLIPADNKNIIYLNGEDVYSPVTLSAYDTIDFGETKLLFVPLCCERFDWNSNNTGGGESGAV